MRLPPQVTPLIEGQGFRIAREWYQSLQAVFGAIIGLTDGDKGDVTVSGSGLTWTIDPGAVTYSKIQDVSSASKLLGRGDSGAGDVEEITLGTGLSMSGTTLNSSALSDGDKGDITVSGSGATWTIDNNVVTYAKMQDVSAASKLLGRGDSGAGDPQEISLGSGLTMSGTTLSASGAGVADADYGDITVSSTGTVWTIDHDAVSDAKLRNSGALSVIGRSANSAGDPADISASAASDAVLRESGSVLGFGTIATGGIANDAVTYAKIQNISATSRILGRKTAGAGDTEECTLSEVLDFIGSATQGDILYRGAAGWARLGAGTAGQFLQTNGAGANPAWTTGGATVGGLLDSRLIRKTSNETVTSSTAFQDDDELFFAIGANEVWAARFVVLLTGGSSTGDWKGAFSAPAGAVGSHAQVGASSAGTGGTDTNVTGYSGSVFTDTELHISGINATASVVLGITFDVLIVNSSNAGNVKLRWAQNVSNGTGTTVVAHSFIKADRYA
ncbi:MAG TPA: hypothetical protein VJM31_00045 [Vicinamibacterales bacterium]|nr:hypothetical protein [Vicinamibacterales bacterium]